MNLETYLQTRKQIELARVLGVTQGAVHQWASGVTKVAVARCIQIEKATQGEVRCEDLRPDVDWAYLRGTAANDAVGDATANDQAREVA